MIEFNDNTFSPNFAFSFGMPEVPVNWSNILTNNLFKSMELPSEDRGHGLPSKLHLSKQYLMNEFKRLVGHFIRPYFRPYIPTKKVMI